MAPGVAWRRFGDETVVHVSERLETHLLDGDGSMVLAALVAADGQGLLSLCASLGLEAGEDARLGLERVLDALTSAGIVTFRPC